MEILISTPEMKRIKSIAILVSIIICQYSCDYQKKDHQTSNEEEKWRSSQILIQSNYFKWFSDSLSSVRVQPNIEKADSVFRQTFLNQQHKIPTNTIIDLLSIYEKDFSELKVSIAFSNEEKAVAHLRMGNLDSVFRQATIAKELYTDLQDQSGTARTEMIIAATMSMKGQFSDALSHQFNALNIYTSLKDSSGFYNTLSEMSINFYNEQKFRRSIELSKRVLRYAESVKDTFMMADQLTTLGSAYHNIDKDDEAKEYILRGIELRKVFDDDFGLSQSYGGMAMINMSENNWEEALRWCERSIELSEEIEDNRNLTAMKYNQATCYFELGDFEKSKNLYEEVISLSEKNDIKDIALIRSLTRLSLIHNKNGSTSREVEVLRKLNNVNQELFDIEKSRITEELQTKYMAAEKQRKLEEVQKNLLSLSEKRMILGLALGLVTILSTFLILVLWQQKKRSKKLLTAEKQLKEEEVKRVNRELQYNREQLNDFTHHLIEKNKVIFELENKLIEKVNTEERESNLESEDEEENGYSNLLNIRILTEDDWSKFKIYFDKVFPGLILKLRQTHSNLTGAEERLFLLLKLKSDSREMSGILGISMESVRKSKYRLKKKLALKENQTLEDFINSF